MFHSTRDSMLKVHASEAILKGLAPDGGLFLPDEIKTLDVSSVLSLSYQELCSRILSLYLDDFTQEEITSCVNKAYGKKNFKDKIISLHHDKDHSFLELFNGPTITFKDMALSLLPHLMDVSIRKQGIDKKVMILTATSGDTGSAALNGFAHSENISINVFYPEGGISPIQEKQMLYFTGRKSRAYSLMDSNFDDCQRIVKALLSKGNDQYMLSSANSINIGRLVPQIVYYYKAYIDLVNDGTISLGEKIDVYVPTGNFGNILACYLAKRMSLPINNLICASNENRILTDFFETGVYDTNREFRLTNSPSMDILISSNFERLLSLYAEDDKELCSYMSSLKEKGKFEVKPQLFEKTKEFKAFSVNASETIDMMRIQFESDHYMIDPHTAVAYGAFLKNGNKARHSLIVSTASPYKFSKAVLAVFHESEEDEYKAIEKVSTLTSIPVPDQLSALIHHDCQPKKLHQEEIEKTLFDKKNFIVKTPGTSANLGIGFDVLGIALSLFNEMKFEKADKDSLVNFLSVKNNLVLQSYQYLFTKQNKDYQPVKITDLDNQVPVSRGLGSSASCIIAGLMAANHMLNDMVSQDKLLEYAIELEGHPDNVAPCLFGGLIASLKTEQGYRYEKLELNPSYRFFLAISEQRLSTAEARKVLPQNLSRAETVYDISHAMLLSKALENGDISLLKECVKDNIHTPYRLPLIKDAELIRDTLKDKDIAFLISGSGSTLLFIAKDDSFLSGLRKLNTGYTYTEAKPISYGASIEEN